MYEDTIQIIRPECSGGKHVVVIPEEGDVPGTVQVPCACGKFSVLARQKPSVSEQVVPHTARMPGFEPMVQAEIAVDQDTGLPTIQGGGEAGPETLAAQDGLETIGVGDGELEFVAALTPEGVAEANRKRREYVCLLDAAPADVSLDAFKGKIVTCDLSWDGETYTLQNKVGVWLLPDAKITHVRPASSPKAPFLALDKPAKQVKPGVWESKP